jgi:hypothetical protein
MSNNLLPPESASFSINSLFSNMPEIFGRCQAMSAYWNSYKSALNNTPHIYNEQTEQHSTYSQF